MNSVLCKKIQTSSRPPSAPDSFGCGKGQWRYTSATLREQFAPTSCGLSTIYGRLHNLGGQVHSPAMARNGFLGWFFPGSALFAGRLSPRRGVLIDFPEQIEAPVGQNLIIDRTLYDRGAIALAE